MEEEVVKPWILILLVAWLLLVIISGIVENYNLPRQAPILEIDFPTPEARTEIIEVDLSPGHQDSSQ